ncbi:MAG: hypothetical protein Q9198_000603 [Flavoplaca austrocitrina]
MPGLELRTVETELDLTYKQTVEDPDIPEAYEALLLDAFRGDYSESVSEEELEASWKIFTPLLHELEGNKDIVPAPYVYGKRSSKKPVYDILTRLFYPLFNSNPQQVIRLFYPSSTNLPPPPIDKRTNGLHSTIFISTNYDLTK